LGKKAVAAPLIMLLLQQSQIQYLCWQI